MFFHKDNFLRKKILVNWNSKENNIENKKKTIRNLIKCNKNRPNVWSGLIFFVARANPEKVESDFYN